MVDINMKFSGFEEVIVGLRNAADRVEDGARKQMHRSADKIVKEAQINAPEDTGALVASIHKEVDYERRDAGGHGGRLKISVVAGGEVNGVNVNAYVARIHELYDEMGTGPRTKLKMEKYPGRVGAHFLTRAADMVEKRLEEVMIEVVRNEWTLSKTGDTSTAKLAWTEPAYVQSSFSQRLFGRTIAAIKGLFSRRKK